MLFISGYSLWVGPVGFWGDSYLFADRAKHLFFQGNLNLNNHGNLVYPPLYSILLAPFYAFETATRVLVLLTLLNSLLVASTIFPVFLLISQYAKADGWECLFFSALVTVSPTFVGYAPMILSEALFIPVLYWTAYAVFRSLNEMSPRWFLAGGFLMAVALLIRSAATGLILSGLFAWSLHLFLLTPGKFTKTAKLLFLGVGAFAVPILCWALLERACVSYQGGAGYSVSTPLQALWSSRSDQWIKLHWTINAGLYFLTAPLSLSAFFVLVVTLRHPAVAIRDPLIPFVVAIIVLAVASIVLLAPTSYGGNPLTWNKYFAPFVGLVTIIALRLRPQLTPKQCLVAFGVAFLLPWFGCPSQLVCHFPDALSAFTNNAHPLPLPAWGRDVVFFLLLCGSAPLLIPFAHKNLRLPALAVAVGFCLISTGACALYWRQAGRLNLKGYDGLAVKLEEAVRAEPSLPVLYDGGILRADPFEAQRFLFCYPRLLKEMPLSSLLLEDGRLSPRFLYITGAILPSAKLLAKDGDNLKLYEVNSAQIRHDILYKVVHGRDVGGPEVVLVDGKKVTGRWLGAEPEWLIQVDRDIPEVQLALRLSVCDHPRKIFAVFNDQRLSEEPTIRRVAWQDGFDYVGWKVRLRAGENRLILKNDSAPVTLPDGVRKVTFMLIDDPVLSLPDTPKL